MDPDTPRPPAARRLWLAALALGAAGVVAGLGAHQYAKAQAAKRLATLATFDLNAALDLAGAEVPPETESFYFFVLEPGARDEDRELADKLVQAAGEHEFLGIAGADADHNRRVLLAALEHVNGQALGGLVLIYVGPPDHEAELQDHVTETGAELRFVPYGPRPEQTI